VGSWNREGGRTVTAPHCTRSARRILVTVAGRPIRPAISATGVGAGHRPSTSPCSGPRGASGVLPVDITSVSRSRATAGLVLPPLTV
jgi:hypothetical protein